MSVIPFPRGSKKPSSLQVTTTHGCGWKITTGGPDAVDLMLAALDDHIQDCTEEPE